MIYFDVTKTAAARHRSGLMRVSERLRTELGERCQPVVWNRGWVRLGEATELAFFEADWLLTPELFSEAERPGFWEFLRGKSVRTAAIFHDAIPLKWPQITWPQSVARHPEYLKMLSYFDRVFAVSNASLRELSDFWTWQGAEFKGRLETLRLGSDLAGAARKLTKRDIGSEKQPPLFLSVGIVEPRKNQGFLADVVESLMSEKIPFRFSVVGRMNPHFGKPLVKRLVNLAKRYSQFEYKSSVNDSEMLTRWAGATATVFPTLAEGCGLPLLESLWSGVPCFCSDLPVLRENGEAGGCEVTSGE